MASFSFEADGKPVQLAVGKIADIEIAVTENRGITQGELIPAWYYDIEQGLWIEEGVGIDLTKSAFFLTIFNLSIV